MCPFTVLRKLEVRTDDESERQAWTASFDIAVGRGLTLYDSAYLELAIRESCGLLTFDAALASVARVCGISVPLNI